MSTVVLTEHNSIVIPDELLKKLGLVPGDTLSVEEGVGELIVRPVRSVVTPVALPVIPASKSLKNLKTLKMVGDLPL